MAALRFNKSIASGFATLAALAMVAIPAARGAAGPPQVMPQNPAVVPGSSVSFATLGKPVPAAYHGTRTAGRTFYDNGGVQLEIWALRDRVTVIESTSGRLTLFGRQLSSGYRAFRTHLQHDGWTSSSCPDGSKGAAIFKDGNETVLEWGKHTVFLGMSVGHGIPPIGCRPPVVAQTAP